MHRIRKAAMVKAINDNANHTVAAYPYGEGYLLTMDDHATLENEHGEIRIFKKLDALAILVKDSGLDSFTVHTKPLANELQFCAKQVAEFPQFEHVVVIETDDGYFIKAADLEEILNIQFNTPQDVMNYASENKLVIRAPMADDS
jgi:hypothetical protein